MKADIRCTCGTWVRRCKDQANRQRLVDPRADPNGTVFVTHFGPIPVVQVEANPEDVPGSEPLRYNLHQHSPTAGGSL